MGGLAAFLTGWMYWYFWIIVVALEAVAGANLLKTWWPGVQPWEFTLGLMALFTVVNLLSGALLAKPSSGLRRSKWSRSYCFYAPASCSLSASGPTRRAVCRI
jgi:amino acid transporter